MACNLNVFFYYNKAIEKKKIDFFFINVSKERWRRTAIG
jgi:hypothetical protein